jgi:hypothetical protein
MLHVWGMCGTCVVHVVLNVGLNVYPCAYDGARSDSIRFWRRLPCGS